MNENESQKPAKLPLNSEEIIQHINELNQLARAQRETEPILGLEAATKALDLAQAIPYEDGQVEAQVNLSHCNGWLGNFTLALTHALEALHISDTLPNYRHRADLYLALARAYMHLSIFDEAIVWGQFAQQQAHDEDQIVEADAANTMGITYYRLEQYERALEMYDLALQTYRAANYQHGVGKAFINTAEALSKLGRHKQALGRAQSALLIAQQEKVTLLEAYAQHTIGQMYANMGKYEEALTPLEKSINLAQQNRNQYVPLVSLIAMGQVYARWSEPEKAAEHFMRGLRLAEDMGNKLYIYRCHEALATFYESRTHWQQALKHYRQFHSIKETVFNEQNMTRIQSLEILHQSESVRKEAEFYQTRNAALEKEIIHRIELEKELKRLATTDSLTRIANRRRFIEVATSEIARAIRHNRPISLALIDLDNLKQLNDSCGHAAGDRALTTLASIVQESIRPTDTLARFGGDEFALLLLETDGAQAYEVLERIRHLLAAQVIEIPEARVSISISSGVSVLRGKPDTLDTLLARADEGLYKAKRAGRNSVFLVE